MKEKINSFASHIASTHLAAIRFCMLVFEKLKGLGLQVSTVKNQLVDGLINLNFTKQLWFLFRVLIHNGLSGTKRQLGCSIDQIMDVIEEHIHHFFVQALQIDHLYSDLHVNSELRNLRFGI